MEAINSIRFGLDRKYLIHFGFIFLMLIRTIW